MTTHRGKILVLRGGAIGDFILTLPVLAALRRQFPQAPLEVLGYPHIAQLALASGLVDEVRPIESRGLAGFFARRGELEERLADYFAGFALILSFLYDPDEILRENVAQSPGLCLCRCRSVGHGRRNKEGECVASSGHGPLRVD